MFGVRNKLDAFWFVSAPDAPEQPWKEVEDMDYDPCASRAAPPVANSLPPLFHACSTYVIPHLDSESGFRLHKDHIHKDLLDCDAPLLRYPPRDALHRYKDKKSEDFQQTWSVCTYTNIVNSYAAAWKRKFCDRPNLEATFEYPPYALGFVNESGWLATTFRNGGWDDVKYVKPPS